MSTPARIAFAAAGVIVIAVVAAIALIGDEGGEPAGDSISAPTAATSAIHASPETGSSPDNEQVEKPKPVRGPLLESGAIVDLDVERGATVRFRVRSEVDDELHVHGYDITKPLPAGKNVNVRFEANLEGVFEIELHGTGEQIGKLTVNP